jgi:hypothetical protein
LCAFSFIETRLFTRLVQEYLNDDEYRELQKALMDNPEPGKSFLAQVVSANLGGARRDEGSVVGIAKISQGVIWMLTMYPKSVAENVPAHVLRQIRKEVENG